MEQQTEQLTAAAAAYRIQPDSPLSLDTLREWHDRLKLPRDFLGRRVWTVELCERVRNARAEARRSRAAA